METEVQYSCSLQDKPFLHCDHIDDVTGDWLKLRTDSCISVILWSYNPTQQIQTIIIVIMLP